MSKFFTMVLMVASMMVASQAQAVVEVTEIWAGGLSGSESTSDWFEVTNFGPGEVDPSSWYYDDDSADPTKNDPLMGVSSLKPGESAIFLASWEDDWSDVADAIAAFQDMWKAPGVTLHPIGYVDGGSGLGGGGDAVWIFDGNMSGAGVIANASYPALTDDDFIDRASFTYDFVNDVWNADRSQVGVFGAYEGRLPATDELSFGPIGSPGRTPEPTTAVLAVLGVAAVAMRRR